MDQDRTQGTGGGKPALKLLLLLVQLDHPVLDLLRRHARDDRVHQLLVIPFGLGEASFQGLSRALSLAPLTPSLNTVIAGLPLSILEELDVRAVEKQVQRPVCRAIRDLHLQGLLLSAQGRIVGNGQSSRAS